MPDSKPQKRLNTIYLLIKIFSLPVLIVLGGSAAANDLPFDKPENVGVATDRLERLSASMQRYIDNNQLAGTVTLVARKGKVIHLESQG